MNARRRWWFGRKRWNLEWSHCAKTGCEAFSTARPRSKKYSNTPKRNQRFYMPKFNYVAMDSRGKETKGTLEVGSQNEAIGRLKEMGYFPTKVVEADKVREKGDKNRAPTKGAAGKGKKKKGGINLNIRIPG